MSDSKISALTELAAAPAVDDVLPIVDVSGTATTKKITTANLLSLAVASTPTGLTYTAATRALSLTSGYMIPGAGTSGQILVSAGASAPAWSTPTVSMTATAGNTLVGDGTNWTSANILSAVPTGLTYTTATRAVSLTSGYMIPGGGSAGQLLTSAGASAPAWTTPTFSATATAGNALIGDGTNWTSANVLSAVPTGLTYTTATRALSLTANYFIPDNTYAGQASIVTTGTVTTGTWGAYVKKIPVDSGNNATVDITAAGNCYGQIYHNTTNDSSTHYDLPAAVVGMSMTFYVNYAGTLVLDPYGGDQFMVITSAADDTLTSDAVIGTFISFVCIVANKWQMVGMNGSWTES